MNDNEKLQARIEELEEALHQIHTWTIAYPPSRFKEPSTGTWEQIHKALSNIGVSSAAVHGSWARHITAGIREICQGVIKVG